MYQDIKESIKDKAEYNINRFKPETISDLYIDFIKEVGFIFMVCGREMLDDTYKSYNLSIIIINCISAVSAILTFISHNYIYGVVICVISALFSIWLISSVKYSVRNKKIAFTFFVKDICIEYLLQFKDSEYNKHTEEEFDTLAEEFINNTIDTITTELF